MGITALDVEVCLTRVRNAAVHPQGDHVSGMHTKDVAQDGKALPKLRAHDIVNSEGEQIEEVVAMKALPSNSY